jgi:hypothetical protein
MLATIISALEPVDFEMTITDEDGNVIERRLYGPDGALIEHETQEDADAVCPDL